MQVDFWDHPRRNRETYGNLTAIMLRGFQSLPLSVCLEYDMFDGTSWTIAVHDEPDFFKIFGSTQISRLHIDGEMQRCLSALCLPSLRKGIPRWKNRFGIMTVLTDDRIPIFLARDMSGSGIESEILFYRQGDPEFAQQLKELGYEQTVYHRTISY
jgi:hypothetical protein